jgi:hypothetical protein
MPLIKRIDEKKILKQYTDQELLIPVTPDPIIDFPDEVDESTTVIGTITNMENNETYDISANYGTVIYSSGNTFQYIIGNIGGLYDLSDTISIRGIIYGRMPSKIIKHTFNIVNTIPATPTPTFIIDSPVHRNYVSYITITNHDLNIESYNVTASLGTIANINIVEGTFDYIAPNNTTGGSLFDVVTVIAKKVGMEESLLASVTVEILNTDAQVVTPILNFPGTVLEETTVVGTITNHVPGNIYTVVPSIGIVSNIVEGAFDYLAPSAITNISATLSITGQRPGSLDSLVLVNNFQVTNSITPNPIVNLPSEVNEYETVVGTITNHAAGITYQITCVRGVIVDNLDGTFDYTPDQVTTDSSDVIVVIATAPGDYQSSPVETSIIIRNVANPTPTPTVNWAGGNVEEETIQHITITNHVQGTTYSIIVPEGIYTWTADDAFDYTASEVSSATTIDLDLRATYPGDFESTPLLIPITITNRVTPTPTAIINDIEEETTGQGTITNHIAGTTYQVIGNLSTISNINNTDGTFDYTTPEVSENTADYINIIATYPGDEPSSVSNNTFTITNRITPTPTMVEIGAIYENMIQECTITNHVAGTTYQISAVYGDIDNELGDTFDYLAPEVELDIIDTITIIATAPGDEPSPPLNSQLIVNYAVGYEGWYCEYSHHSKYHYHNPLKSTTTTNSNSTSSGFNILPNVPVYCLWTPVVTTSSGAFFLGGSSVASDRIIKLPMDNSVMNSNGVEITPTLAQSAAGGTANLIKNKIYYIGGIAVSGLSTVQVGTVNEAGDIVSDFVTTTSFPTTIYFHSSIVTKNKLFIVGGYRDGYPGTMSDRVYYSNIDTNGNLGAWQQSSPMPEPVRAGKLMLTETRMYYLEQYADWQPDPKIYSAPMNVDGSIGTWSTVFTNTRVGHNLVVFKNRFISFYQSSPTELGVYSGEIGNDGILHDFQHNTHPVSYACVQQGATTIVTEDKIYFVGGHVWGDQGGGNPCMLTSLTGIDGWDPRKNDSTVGALLPNTTGVPTLSSIGDIDENTYVEVTITNYFATYTYNISCTIGTISHIVGNTFRYNAPDVSNQVSGSVSVIATAPGSDPSNPGYSLFNIVPKAPLPSVAKYESGYIYPPWNLSCDTRHIFHIINFQEGDTFTVDTDYSVIYDIYWLTDDAFALWPSDEQSVVKCGNLRSDEMRITYSRPGHSDNTDYVQTFNIVAA